MKKLSFFDLLPSTIFSNRRIYCLSIRKLPDKLIILTLFCLAFSRSTHSKPPKKHRKFLCVSFYFFFFPPRLVPSSPSRKRKSRLTIRVHARSIDFGWQKFERVLSEGECLFNRQFESEWTIKMIISMSCGFPDFNFPLLPFQKGDRKIKGNKTRKSCDRNSNRGPRTVGWTKEKKTVSF